MEPIEIRYKRKWMIPLLIVFFTGLVLGVYFTFFTNELNGLTGWKFYAVFSGSIALYAWFAFIIFITAGKIVRKEYVLRISREAIEIKEILKCFYLAWNEITGWEIIKEDSSDNLIIKTKDRKKKTGISWLEKKPAEIEQLLKEYEQAAKAPQS